MPMLGIGAAPHPNGNLLKPVLWLPETLRLMLIHFQTYETFCKAGRKGARLFVHCELVEDAAAQTEQLLLDCVRRVAAARVPLKCWLKLLHWPAPAVNRMAIPDDVYYLIDEWLPHCFIASLCFQGRRRTPGLVASGVVPRHAGAPLACWYMPAVRCRI